MKCSLVVIEAWFDSSSDRRHGWSICAGFCGCPPGEEASGDDGCTPCAIGFSKLVEGNAKCSPCAPGSYVSRIGATSCSLCAPGDIQPLLGQSACKRCPTQLSSAEGSDECDVCAVGFFRHDEDAPASTTTCMPCIEGVGSLIEPMRPSQFSFWICRVVLANAPGPTYACRLHPLK